MMKTLVLFAAFAAAATAHEGCEHGEVITRAIVRLEGNGVTGNVTFTRQENGKMRITGRVTGMPPGKYGFHVHEKGDLTLGCGSTLAHFNPDGNDHGHPEDKNRHAGDLGNIVFDDSKVANIDFEDSQVTLMGAHNIIGRGLVLHEKHDDYGKSDHPDSKKTGNAGARVACGVIGILDTARVKSGGAKTAAVTSLLTLTAAAGLLITMR